MSKKATILADQIIAAVKAIGGTGARVNVAGIVRGGKWTKTGSKRGYEDVDITYPIELWGGKVGIKVAVEIKIGKDRQSEVQKIRQKEVEEAGGIYIIAKNLQQFVNDLNLALNTKINGN